MTLHRIASGHGLDRLYDRGPDGCIRAGRWSAQRNATLDDVREALRHPVDEDVWDIVRRVCPPWAQSELEADLVRAILAAFADGEVTS